VAYEKIIGAVKRRTISALIYPAILVAMMCVLVGIIVIRVVPAFSDFYASFDRELPLSTRIIVAVSDAIVGSIWIVVPAGAIVAIACWRWVQRPSHRVHIDRLLLRLPIGGATIQKFSTSQLARTLATLLGGGIPLVNALDIAGGALSNRHLTVELQEVTRRVREGESFASALASRGVFTDVAIKMVEVGESTGALQEMLNSLADFYDDEIETEVARFITLIEPVVLVAMGVIIAAVVLALYMPMFELGSAFGA
jgi:type IV pilus assembly protein PilC